MTRWRNKTVTWSRNRIGQKLYHPWTPCYRAVYQPSFRIRSKTFSVSYFQFFVQDWGRNACAYTDRPWTKIVHTVPGWGVQQFLLAGLCCKYGMWNHGLLPVHSGIMHCRPVFPSPKKLVVYINFGIGLKWFKNYYFFKQRKVDKINK